MDQLIHSPFTFIRTLFPRNYATALEIDLEKDCEKEMSLGVGGRENVYQYSSLPIKVNGWETKIPIGFLESSNIPPLLGRLNCLERLKVSFYKHTTLFEN